MAAPAPDQTEKLRTWWWHRQGLGRVTASATPAEVLERSGWARSVGGCSPYFTLFSRAHIPRATVDAAVAQVEICELPSARRCTYVVPQRDYALALHLAQFAGPGEMRVAEKLGVTAKEVDKAAKAVLAALRNGPLTPDEIKDACGGAIRSLGAEGQKKGLSSTLPLVLGELQRAGEIRRIPANGRLDQQRYQYTLWQPNPLGKVKLTAEQANIEIGKRFFEWIAPAPLSDFQTFAGLSAKSAKAAVEQLKLEPISAKHDLLIPSHLRSEFENFKPPKDQCYRLTTMIDSFVLLHGDLRILIDPKELGHPLLAASTKSATGTLADLSSPVILERGCIAGLWEYDPAKEAIAYATFGKADGALKKAVAETEDYIRSQLGDARTFSLDSPKSRAPRIEVLRSLGR